MTLNLQQRIQRMVRLPRTALLGSESSLAKINAVKSFELPRHAWRRPQREHLLARVACAQGHDVHAASECPE
ncbi:hypothetical protein [Corynebacterium aurimucosum]